MELFKRADDDLRGCSPPSGVNGCNGASLRIEQEDRDTVGCPDADDEPRLVRDQSVTFFLPITQAVSPYDAVGMDLAEGDVGCGSGMATTEPMFLPNEPIERQTTVNAF